MLQHQVGAQHSQYFLVLVRRLPYDKDYIVAATIVLFARPLYSTLLQRQWHLLGVLNKN